MKKLIFGFVSLMLAVASWTVFADDNTSDAGQAAEGAVEATGDAVGDTVNAAGDIVSGTGNAISDATKDSD